MSTICTEEENIHNKGAKKLKTENIENIFYISEKNTRHYSSVLVNNLERESRKKHLKKKISCYSWLMSKNKYYGEEFSIVCVS